MHSSWPAPEGYRSARVDGSLRHPAQHRQLRASKLDSTMPSPAMLSGGSQELTFTSSSQCSDLTRQLYEDSTEQVVAHGAGVDVLLYGEAVGECQHHGHGIVNGEVPDGRISTKDL
jgi:hypothetical protein